MWSIMSPTGTQVPLTDLSVTVRAAPGAGMPPFAHVLLDAAQQAGATYRQSLGSSRRLTLRLVARQRHATLHATRQALIRALNPDLAQAGALAYLVYEGVTKTLRLPVFYDSGLEDPNREMIEVHVLAPDPVWTASEQQTQTLATRAALLSAAYVLQRSAAGVWEELGGLNDAAYALLVAADGTRYAGGAFTDYVRRWDAASGQWQPLAAAVLDGSVYCLAEDAAGNIYAGGSFSTPGSSMAYWDGTAWQAMGNPSLLPYMLAVGNDGTVYAGGFDLSGTGVSVRAWDGSAWSALASGPGGTVHALIIDSSGTLVAGGNFADGVKRWTGISWQTVGGGLSQSGGGTPTVRALARGPDGMLYAGGDFDRADGAFAGSIARWNGTTWEPLGEGVGNQVSALAVRPTDGTLLAGGTFTVAGGRAMPDKMAQWNGYAWFPLDIDIAIPNITPTPPDPDIDVLAAAPDGAMLVAYGAETTATSAALTTLANAGSAAAYPTLTMTGEGRVYQLVNWTTGDALYFDIELLPGEVLTVDMRPTHKSVVSSFRGNVLGAVVPGSALARWRLLPGTNHISLFVNHASASASLAWQERYWSLDGADV